HGSMTGSGGVMVFDESVDLVKVCGRAIKFLERESCGKCSPCREGVGWLRSILDRVALGSGRDGDIDLLLEVSKNIMGKTFCPLGDSAAGIVQNFVEHFKSEFEAHVNKDYPTHPPLGKGRSEEGFIHG